jgi:hypothetical protein
MQKTYAPHAGDNRSGRITGTLPHHYLADLDYSGDLMTRKLKPWQYNVPF